MHLEIFPNGDAIRAFQLSRWNQVYTWWTDEILQHIEDSRITRAVLQLKWKGDSRYNKLICDWWPRNELPLLMKELDEPTGAGGAHPLHYISDIRKHWDWPETLLTLVGAQEESEEDLASALLSASINPRLLMTRNRVRWQRHPGWKESLNELKDIITRTQFTRVPWCHVDSKPTMPLILPDLLVDNLEDLVRYFAREHAQILEQYQMVRIHNTRFVS